MTAVEFFKSSRYSHLFSGTKGHQQSFWRTLNTFDNEKLENTYGKRSKYRNFAIHQRQTYQLHQTKSKEVQIRQIWYIMDFIAVEVCKWAVDLWIENFKFSDGWISDTLQRHGIKRVNLHGYKNDMTEE